MINKFIILLLTISLISCGRNSIKSNHDSSKDSLTLTDTLKVIPKQDSLPLVEKFVDSLNIGYKGENMVEVRNYQGNDSGFVEIEFFDKQNGKWGAKQIFTYEKDDLLGCDVKIKDFNNDGFNDLTYISATAARGSNEVRKLFIFDKQWSSLIYMENSEEFPNMQYNKELNCIDSWIVTGGVETVFIRIEGDSLKEFASVDIFDDKINITTTDKEGNIKYLIKNKTYTNNDFPRFKNYNPLKQYEVKE